MIDEIPEEDRLLAYCDHRWCDMYNGSGISKDDPEIVLVAFFCKKCLEIKIKSYNQSRYKLNPEIYED